MVSNAPGRFLPAGVLSVVALALLTSSAHGQPAEPAATLTPTQLIEARLDHHDPDRLWWTRRHEVGMHQTRPEGPSREVDVTLHPSSERFGIRLAQEGLVATGTRDGEECSWGLEGGEVGGESGPGSSAPETPFGELTCERLAFWQRYQTFVLSLPMNLLDEGATLAPEVTSTSFDGWPVDAIEVSYGEGQPVYELFFDPETHALVGLRFHREDVTRDGEYIVFEGEVEHGGVRLPKARTWYMNVDDSLLGTDTIVSFAAPGGS